MKKKTAQDKTGSVVKDGRRGTWSYLYYDKDGKRRSKLIGSTKEYRSKDAAWAAAEAFVPRDPQDGPTVREIVKGYMKERMPKRYSTRRGYRSYLRNHILPRWGGRRLMKEMQPRPVQLWIDSLDLEPKSRGHVKSLLGFLWEYAMFAGFFPVGVNPMSLVHVAGVSKRSKVPITITPKQFLLVIAQLIYSPLLRTMAILCGCLGLRISEALALRWSHLDELGSTLLIQRAIVQQVEDTVKTEYSERPMPIDAELMAVLLEWKSQCDFSAPEDYIFASAVQIGRLPMSYNWTYKQWRAAAQRAGITGFGCHTLRHSYRSWLDEIGTEIGVQKNLMRHADISMTTKYGNKKANQREVDALSKITAITLGELGKQHAAAGGEA